MTAHQRAEALFKEAEKLGCDTPTEGMTADAFSDMEFNHQQAISRLERENQALRDEVDRLRGQVRQEKEHHEFYRGKVSDYMGAEQKLVERFAALRQAAEGARVALEELHAMVRGECPSLLNEDSGGDGALDLQIEEALAELRKVLEKSPDR